MHLVVSGEEFHKRKVPNRSSRHKVMMNGEEVTGQRRDGRRLPHLQEMGVLKDGKTL